jgi:Ion channel
MSIRRITSKRSPLRFTHVLITIIQFIILGIFIINFRRGEPGWEFVTLLFSVPILLQIIGITLLRSLLLRIFYSLIALIASSSNFACWLYYILQPETHSAAAPLCIAVSTALVVVAFLITSAMFRDSLPRYIESPVLEQLSKRIGTSPSGELLLFLAFFVSIGYLFGFAFAFHDRSLTTEGQLPGLRANAALAYEFTPPPEPPEGDARRPADEKWYFYFPPNSANLFTRQITLGDRPRYQSEIEELLAHNTETLEDLTKRLQELGRRNRIRVTLIGRSSLDRPLGTRYDSSYELAEARARTVQTALIQQLSEANLSTEWVLVPLSVTVPREYTRGYAGTLRPDMSVEVSVTAERDENIRAQRLDNDRGQYQLLPLLPHMYFAIYTITTTGYGDIHPATPFAMFACTLANLYEIFFLVIFFNVLLSPKVRGRNGPTKISKPLLRVSAPPLDETQAQSGEVGEGKKVISPDRVWSGKLIRGISAAIVLAKLGRHIFRPKARGGKT